MNLGENQHLRESLLTELDDPAMLPRRRMSPKTMEMLPVAYIDLESAQLSHAGRQLV
jgi:hypothetical protein